MTAAASSRSIRASRKAGPSSSPIRIAPGGHDMQSRRARRTKIIATLGPASDTPEMITRLFGAGADVFRLNLSHLPREKLRERVAVLADLQGPKLRVGAFTGDAAMLEKGQTFTLDADNAAGDARRVYLSQP